jgi:death-on-curing protein
MTEPVWLNREDALGIHEMMLAQHGGLAGVRDQGMLDSALARQQNMFAYEQASTPAMAAAYATGVIKNHPFLDGNKRTGFMLAAVFLELNAFEFGATEESVVEFTLGLAASKITEEEYARWLEAESREQ